MQVQDVAVQAGPDIAAAAMDEVPTASGCGVGVRIGKLKVKLNIYDSEN